MELFALLLFDPREAFNALSMADAGYRGLWVLLGAIVSASTGAWLFGQLPAWPAGLLHMIFGVVSNFIIFVFLFFLVSALYNFFAELYGGRGTGLKLFKMLIFSSFPFIFTAPAALIAQALFPGAGGVIAGVAAVFLFAWSVYFQLGIIRSAYGISTPGAVAVLALPWTAAFITLMLLAVSGLLIAGAMMLS